MEAMLGDKLWRSLGANERFEFLGIGEPMIAVEPANNKMVLDFVKTYLKNCKMGRKKKESGSRDIRSHCDIPGKTYGF